MVPEHEVVSQLDHPLNVVRVALFQEKQQLSFHRGLVVVLFLVLHELDCNQLLVLVVHALNDLAESAFTDNFDELVSVGNVIVFLDSVVAFIVVEPVVDQSLELGRFDFGLIFTQVVDLLKLIDLRLFETGQILLSNAFLFCHFWVHGESK